MTCWFKQFSPLFTTICCSQEVGQLSSQTALQGGEEGAIQNVTGDLSDDRRSFLTILDNILTVGGSARGEKQADQPQLQSGGLPEGAGGGMENGAAANVAEALCQ
jgi:hypothetical protein